MQFDRRWGLLLFALGLWIWMAYSIISHTATHTIKAVIIQSKTPLRTIESRVTPRKREELWIDKLYFPQGNELRHPIYGYLGYKNNFVIYLTMRVNSLRDQNITFDIYSDDGFRLWVDGKMVAQYPKDRPFRKSTATIFLPKGEHHIKLKYFQGYGQLGLKAVYRTDDGSSKLFGEDSNSLEFLENDR
ncbi:MAG: hypothetical protein C6I05_00115 [Epsilonproteobacteria bacterium]|nr:hypothetical protein [Campylobacterota bacterium]